MTIVLGDGSDDATTVACAAEAKGELESKAARDRPAVAAVVSRRTRRRVSDAGELVPIESSPSTVANNKDEDLKDDNNLDVVIAVDPVVGVVVVNNCSN